MLDNLPPLPAEAQPAKWTTSFKAYVLHGSTFVEHGIAKQQTGQLHHMLKLEIGASQGDVLELRVLDPVFFNARSFTAFMKRNGERFIIGTAFPHEDGKGYQLKLSEAIDDGGLIALHSDGILETGGRGRRPKRQARLKPGS